MFEALLGNKSAEKIMLTLYVNEDLHALAIASTQKTAKLYRYNQSHPLKEMVSIAYGSKDLKMQKVINIISVVAGCL